MSICGYPPRDLLAEFSFVYACENAVHQIARESRDDVCILVGHPRFDSSTGRLRNSVSVLQYGQLITTCDKQLLPSYDIFDEKRYFESGFSSLVFQWQDAKVGIAICEDFWRGLDSYAAPVYDIDPIEWLIDGDCSIIISPCASPFVTKKREAHVRYAMELAAEHSVTIVVNNQVGGNDDLIFDGGSFAVSPEGMIGSCPLFDIGATVFETTAPARPFKLLSSEDKERFNALRLGVHDYFNKTNHRHAYIGLSGGIDSALTAAIAVAALGSKAVTGVLLPSRFSSLGSIEDAEQLASNLGIDTITLPIEHLHRAFERTLEESCLDATGLASENAQARIRGLLLMARANQDHALLLATGNKSELAVGYSTLYGDMAGAISVIGDVYKTEVWSMAMWINRTFEELGFTVVPIPIASIEKPPSAELRPDQLDADSLPPYEDLDAILRLHIEQDMDREDIEDELDIDSEVINTVLALVDRAEFKREQASVILKVSPRTFGRGRRMPIVMRRSWQASRETT